MNNTFSFSRFGRVLKRDLVENRKRYIGVFFVMFVAFLVYQFYEIKEIAELGQIFVRKNGELHIYEKADYLSRFVNSCLPFFYGVLSLALLCSAADMTGRWGIGLGTRRRRRTRRIGYLAHALGIVSR